MGDLFRDLVDRGLTAIDKLLRGRIIERFGGPSRVPLLDNGDRLIAEGAARMASDGQPLTLSNPFEVLHADQAYVPFLDADAELPTICDWRGPRRVP